MRYSKSSKWVGLMLWLAGCTDADSVRDAEVAAPSADEYADAGDDPRCSSELPPLIEPHTISLWPPNHKLHEISVEDCVSARDACDNPLRGTFVWASSDEPIDDIGDGHHAPDLGLSADHTRVCVRAERQGPMDGRVYKLGVRVLDDQGNLSEVSCSVVIDHDQRGVMAADSGEAYRVVFEGTQFNSALCGDDPTAPPPPPPPPVDRPGPD